MKADVQTGRIAIDDLRVRLGQGAQAFDAVQDITLHVEPGEFVCLLGLRAAASRRCSARWRAT
jgi:NitT/TauT family transport system ATP-binding protein